MAVIVKKGCHADYLCEVVKVSERNERLDAALSELENVNFDAIVIIGVGGIFGAMLAAELNMPLIVVRKDDDDSHSWSKIESGIIGEYNIDSNGEWICSEKFKWLFVDDQIFTGTTFLRTHQKMQKAFPNAEFVGTYEYNYNSYKDNNNICLKRILSK